MDNGFAPTLGSTYNPVQTGSGGPALFNPYYYQQANTQVPTPGLVPAGVEQVATLAPVLSKAGTISKVVTGLTAMTSAPTYAAAGALPWQTAGGVMNPTVAASGAIPTGAAAPSAVASGLSTAGAFAGAAAIGYFGGSKIGEMLGGSPTGGAVGGTAGAIIGQALIPIPFVGAGIGAVVGSTIGQFFGNKDPSDYTQAGGININTQQVVDRYAKEESSTGKKFNSNVAALRDNVQQGANTFTKWLIDNGATPKTDPSGKQKDMLFIIGGRDGFRTAMMDNGWDRSVRVEEKNLNGYKNYGKDYKAYSNGIADQLLSNFNVDDTLKAKFEEMKKNGEIDDIAAFGATKQQYSQTYSQDLIKSTQRDTLIAAPKTPNTKWKDFITTYNSKYEANRA
jgi:hypothetical protein